MENIQQKVLNKIKEQTGVELVLCDHFTGIKTHRGRKYFNALLKEKVSESLDFDILLRYCAKYKDLYIEQNGVERIAIFFDYLKYNEYG